MSVKFNSPDVQMAMDLFMIRGAYGYKGFSEKVSGNLYKSDFGAFRDAIENATNPIDPSKVSKLSPGQMKVLSSTSSGNSLIPLLNRMGELGMMDFREGMVSPEILNRIKSRLQNNPYASSINAYKRSI